MTQHVCCRYPSALDAIVCSVCQIISVLSLISLDIIQPTCQFCKTGKQFYNYEFPGFVICSLKPVLPHSPTTQSDQSHLLAWAFCLRDHPSLDGPLTCSDIRRGITRRHKVSQGVTRASHTSNILQGEKRGKSALPKMRGLGLKPRGCASAPLQKLPCHNIKPLIIRTEWQCLRSPVFLSILTRHTSVRPILQRKKLSQRRTLLTVTYYEWMGELLKETAVQRKA